VKPHVASGKPPPGHVFVGSLAEINPRKVTEVVRGSRHKKRPCGPFFALSPKPIVQFRWKRARLSLFRPQPHLPSFIQIHPSFRDLLVKTIISDPISIGDRIADPIGDRIADNNNNNNNNNNNYYYY